VHQVGHYPEFHQDARSTKYKTPVLISVRGRPQGQNHWYSFLLEADPRDKTPGTHFC
jgi:hypothetical protein